MKKLLISFSVSVLSTMFLFLSANYVPDTSKIELRNNLQIDRYLVVYQFASRANDKLRWVQTECTMEKPFDYLTAQWMCSNILSQQPDSNDWCIPVIINLIKIKK